jgi:hypothetical protein
VVGVHQAGHFVGVAGGDAGADEAGAHQS